MKDRYDLAAAVLSETDAGVRALNALLDLGAAAEELEEIDRSAVRTVLSFVLPADPSADADLRRKNPVHAPDVELDGKEAAAQENRKTGEEVAA